jgi:quercetin dioxygenase-like cupin family protein
MTMDLMELAALDAVGALGPGERRAFERTLAAAPDDVRAEVAACREAAVAIAEGLPDDAVPAPDLKDRVMARIDEALRPLPEGFSIRFGKDDDWRPHPVPGVKMKVLALNRTNGYATLLLDVGPGVRFPSHHHSGAEECYVVSGSLFSCGRRIAAGDFLHADGDTDHGEIWTEEGCRVLLVVPPEDEMPDPTPLRK